MPLTAETTGLLMYELMQVMKRKALLMSPSYVVRWIMGGIGMQGYIAMLGAAHMGDVHEIVEGSKCD